MGGRVLRVFGRVFVFEAGGRGGEGKGRRTGENGGRKGGRKGLTYASERMMIEMTSISALGREWRPGRSFAGGVAKASANVSLPNSVLHFVRLERFVCMVSTLFLRGKEWVRDCKVRQGVSIHESLLKTRLSLQKQGQTGRGGWDRESGKVWLPDDDVERCKNLVNYQSKPAKQRKT